MPYYRLDLAIRQKIFQYSPNLVIKRKENKFFPNFVLKMHATGPSSYRVNRAIRCTPLFASYVRILCDNHDGPVACAFNTKSQNNYDFHRMCTYIRQNPHQVNFLSLVDRPTPVACRPTPTRSTSRCPDVYPVKAKLKKEQKFKQ